MNGNTNHDFDLNFEPPHTGVLAHFSPDSGESVTYVLIRELIDHVDRPTVNTHLPKIQFNNENELNWIMQVINHAFFLPMQNARDYETVRSAVRIYLAWLTGINVEPHPACPRVLKENPVKYFSQILDALRALFLPRALTMSDSLSQMLTNRQANEMRTILLALRNFYGRKATLKENCKQIMWHQTLRFSMAVTDNLLSKPAWPEELSFVMASDLSEIMFDAWTQASLLGHINPDKYWRRLSELAQGWITYVNFIECWARKLLALTAVFSQKIYGLQHSNIVIHDDKLLNAAKHALHDQSGQRALNDTWHELVNLIGNPANFFDKAEQLCEKYGADSNLQSYVMDQTSLSFYLAVSAYTKMVDVFFGDSTVSIDFHEIEELYAQWLDVNKTIQDELTTVRSNQPQSHRASNMSTTSSNHSNNYSNGTHEQNTGTLTHHSLAQASALALGTASLSQQKRSLHSHHPKSSSTRLSSRSIHHSVSLQTDQMPIDNGQQNGSAQNSVNTIKAGQYVWYIMKSNRLRSLKTQSEHRPPTDALLEMFLPWLYNAAAMPLSTDNRKYSEDVISQSSSTELEQQQQQMMIDSSGVNRRSFATSTASSSDISSPIGQHGTFGGPTATLTTSQLADPQSIPSVDGVAAGRASALGALCRIVCAKPSTERLNDEQLAQFLNLMHDALIERDRLILCSLIFHSTELFKLGLRGVEVLFPNYAMAIDLVLTESFKLRLNPSIHEIDMRHACLRAMASILAWPTTFGLEEIIPLNASPRLHHGTQNLLEPGACYLDVRSRILKNLVHTLRNETDSMNLQLALALSSQLCSECTLYDLQPNASTPQANPPKPERKNSTLSATDDSTLFVVSALKRIVSAICDNLCKAQWASELATTLAAFDFLNAIATQPKQVLFHKMELSIGSLIVSSLCRFVNCQLQKPPPFHSKDLHSSVVAAFQCLEVWLCAAPMLCEMESCVATVAQTIEYGMSGGNGLSPEEFKPASQRVYDAAECLQHSLFSSSCASDSIVDEKCIIKKLGDDNLSMDKFQHFLIDKTTLLSLHDITCVDFVSKGLPTLVMISRTPHRAAHASLIQLRPSSHENKENLLRDSSPRTPTTSIASNSMQAQPSENKRTSSVRKAFEFTRDMLTPKCQLDAALQRQKEDGPEVAKVENQLHTIRDRLASGAGCAVGDRDASNVWIQSSLGALLCKPPTPEDCVRKCNSIRVFLYDMGLINRAAFGNDLIALDTSNNITDFYSHLHQLVDKQPAKRCESVFLFYVRRGQQNASDILQNSDKIETLSNEFCTLISRLGRVRDTKHSNSRFWSGHWSSAFHVQDDETNGRNGNDNLVRLDGINNCIWSSDQQLEISYTLPTDRTVDFNLKYMSGTSKDDGPKTKEAPRYTPSSTSSSLMPASRTGSSLTNETSANKPDISHPPTSPAIRTRSTSTINSESSGSQKPTQPTNNTDRQSNLSQGPNAVTNVRRSADQRILVVWLERIEDMSHFPYEQLLPATDDGSRRFATKTQRSDLHILFVHNFEPGLVRVHVESVWTKTGQTGPLVDGVVVSTCALPSLLRQTVSNLARRKAVEIDQPSNSYRRKQSILELAKKFQTQIGYTEFLDRFITV